MEKLCFCAFHMFKCYLWPEYIGTIMNGYFHAI
uniref:Uncharacterized protein n=1 Tax=Rhizophora mucronata TaxID=61149 RepID=A0A2P2NF99_RHIMU